jgi:CRP-like cAMP-binding protein
LSVPDSPTLTPPQLATIAEVGEERTASEGDTLYRIGDERYPFIVILEGDVAVLDAAGNEITRHGPSKFLGEVNLLSGQAAFVTAVAASPLRYIAVDREALRSLLFEDGPLSSLVLATFIARREALQQVAGLGMEIIGPHSSALTMRLVEFARSNRLPFTWRNPELAGDPDAGALVAGKDPRDRVAPRPLRAVQLHDRPHDVPALPTADRPRAAARASAPLALLSALLRPIVALAGPRSEEEQQPRTPGARNRAPLVRLEGHQRPGRGSEALTA